MKKLALLFAIALFTSITASAQFELTSYKCGKASNTAAPVDVIYGKDPGGESKVFEYYYDGRRPSV